MFGSSPTSPDDCDSLSPNSLPSSSSSTPAPQRDDDDSDDYFRIPTPPSPPPPIPFSSNSNPSLPSTYDEWCSQVLIGTRSKEILALDLETGQLTTRIPTEQTVVRIKTLPHIIAEDDADDTLRVWTCECSWGGHRGVTEISLERFSKTRIYDSHTGVNDFSTTVLHDRTLIVTACDDHLLHVNVASTGERLTSLARRGSSSNRHPGQIASVTCVPSTSRVFSGDTSQTLRCYDLEKGGCVTRLVAESPFAHGSLYLAHLLFEPRLNVIISGTNSGAFQLWDARVGGEAAGGGGGGGRSVLQMESICEDSGTLPLRTSNIASLDLLKEFVVLSSGRSDLGLYDIRCCGGSGRKGTGQIASLTLTSFAESESHSRLGLCAVDENHFVVTINGFSYYSSTGAGGVVTKYAIPRGGGGGEQGQQQAKVVWETKPGCSVLGVGVLGYDASGLYSMHWVTEGRVALEDEAERLGALVGVWSGEGFFVDDGSSGCGEDDAVGAIVLADRVVFVEVGGRGLSLQVPRIFSSV